MFAKSVVFDALSGLSFARLNLVLVICCFGWCFCLVLGAAVKWDVGIPVFGLVLRGWGGLLRYNFDEV